MLWKLVRMNLLYAYTICEMAALRQIGKAAAVSTKFGSQVERHRNET
jgi:hypothetical protein